MSETTELNIEEDLDPSLPGGKREAINARLRFLGDDASETRTIKYGENETSMFLSLRESEDETSETVDLELVIVGGPTASKTGLDEFAEFLRGMAELFGDDDFQQQLLANKAEVELDSTE